MENKKNKPARKPRKNPSTQKPQRSYIRPATKAATHPVRAQILKALKESDKSTVELESVTGEARYNLYHHLHALEQRDFISYDMRDNKTKLYHLKNRENPEEAVIVLDENDIKKNKDKFKLLINTLSEIQGEKIQAYKRIVNAEICLYYSQKKGK
ncbi:ArsR/SmtB family transcription factor [Acidobacteriota bacterium]